MIRPVSAEISQRFGENPTRDLPASSWLIQTFGNYQPDGHTGEDYACPVGTPVRAVTAGTVLHIGWMGGTYDRNPWWIQPSFAGYHAVIDHGSFIGIYGHCKDGSAKVSKGDRVSEGQVFILSGNTGGSTGPHLHFEVMPDRYVLNSKFYGRIDPEPLFTGSLSYASESITKAQEDEVTPDQMNAILSAIKVASDESTNAKNNGAEAIRVATDARNEGTNAKNYALAALQGITGLLQTRLPDPNDPERQYSLADWIVFGNLKAGGAQQVVSSLTPELIAEAVAKASAGVDAQAIADRLQVTVKEGQ